MTLDVENTNNVIIILVVCFVSLIIILAIVAFIIAITKRTKKMELSKGVKIDTSVYENNELLDMFGENNIVSVEYEMSRVTVEVVDIEKVNTEGLQQMGADGILLVGNKVKCNFKENAEAIAEYLKGTK